MNLEHFSEIGQNMGPVFWIAALAIALGATLLMLSILTQIKSLGIKSPKWQRGAVPRFHLFKRNGKKLEEGNTTGISVRKTNNGYEPVAGTPRNMPATSEQPNTGVNPELVIRLRQAADTLEEVKRSLQKDLFTPGYSELKDPGESVEYLFKTTVA